MSDFSQGPGWWQASDGKWYPPEAAPAAAAPAPTGPPAYAAPTGPPPGGPPAYGTPMGNPGYAAPGGPVQLADWGTRVASYAIDGLALGILANVISTASRPLGSLLSLLSLAFVIYNAYLNGATGQSIGKRIMGTKVVSEATGQPIGGGLGIVRWLAHIIDSVICLVGWFFPLWDAKKQTIADKIMKTVVITGEPKQSFGDAIKPS